MVGGMQMLKNQEALPQNDWNKSTRSTRKKALYKAADRLLKSGVSCLMYTYSYNKKGKPVVDCRATGLHAIQKLGGPCGRTLRKCWARKQTIPSICQQHNKGIALAAPAKESGEQVSGPSTLSDQAPPINESNDAVNTIPVKKIKAVRTKQTGKKNKAGNISKTIASPVKGKDRKLVEEYDSCEEIESWITPPRVAPSKEKTEKPVINKLSPRKYRAIQPKPVNGTVPVPVVHSKPMKNDEKQKIRAGSSVGKASAKKRDQSKQNGSSDALSLASPKKRSKEKDPGESSDRSSQHKPHMSDKPSKAVTALSPAPPVLSSTVLERCPVKETFQNETSDDNLEMVHYSEEECSDEEEEITVYALWHFLRFLLKEVKNTNFQGKHAKLKSIIQQLVDGKMVVKKFVDELEEIVEDQLSKSQVFLFKQCLPGLIEQLDEGSLQLKGIGRPSRIF